MTIAGPEIAVERAKGVGALALPGFVPTPPRTNDSAAPATRGIPQQPTRQHQRYSDATSFPWARNSPAPIPIRDERPTTGPVRDMRTPDWLADYRRHVIGLDVAVVAFCVLLGQFSRFDRGFIVSVGPAGVAYEWVISAALVALWLVLLATNGGWDTATLGVGKTEFRRVVVASLLFAAVVGIIGYLSSADIFRGYLIVSVPIGTAGLLAGHRWWRRGLTQSGRSGSHLRTLLAVGDRVATTIAVPPGPVPVPGQALPEQIWRLRTAGVRLTVDRSLLGADGSDGRELIPGLPLVAVSALDLRGRQRVVKMALDLGLAALALLLLSPLLLLSALVVVLADGGPAFAIRDWQGVGGRLVRVWSFRCTPRRPKARLASAAADDLAAPNGAGPNDNRYPRYQVDTTGVGAVLRRTGIECAPHLFAVLTGRVSLVGPKPRAAGEPVSVAIMVKPGLTGPWRVITTPQVAEPPAGSCGQVTPDSVSPGGPDRVGDAREDFEYVGQWSAAGDLRILTKTVVEVVAGRDQR